MTAVDPTGSDVLDAPGASALATRGGLVRVAGYGAGSACALLGTAVLTRYLGVSDYGRYQTVVSLLLVVATVTDAGMATLGLREVAQRDGSERLVLLRTLLGLRIVLSLAGGGVAVAVVALSGYGGSYVAGAALAALGLAVLVAQTTQAIMLHAALRLGTVAGIDFARAALTAAAYVALAAAGAPVALLLGVAVPVNLVLLALTVRSVGAGALRPRVEPRRWGALLRATAGFAAAAAAGTTYLYTAQLTTALVADARAAGLFAASFRVFVVVGSVPALFVSSSFALLARTAGDRARFSTEVRRLQGLAVLAGGGMALALGVAARPVLDVMAGPDYAAAAPVLRLHAVALFVTCVLVAWGFALLAAHRHRALLLANVAALVVSVVAVALLADAYGARGAALGTVMAELTLAGGYAVALVRGGVRPAGAPVLVAAVAALPGMVVVAAAPGLPDLAAAALALVAYGIVVGGVVRRRAGVQRRLA